jgi:hypothetical protein
MKKLFSFLLFTVLVFGLAVSSAMAAGGKVRGDEGQGSVNQTCDPVLDSPCGPGPFDE